MARTSKIDEEAISSYSSPQTVSKLQEEVPSPARGPLESAEELPTTGEYYDGNLKLNVVKVNCNLYASQEDCIHNSKCGWCGSRNGCVLGNNFGPLEACVRASFIYGQRYPGTATERRIDERVGGATMTVIHPQPTS